MSFNKLIAIVGWGRKIEENKMYAQGCLAFHHGVQTCIATQLNNIFHPFKLMVRKGVCKRPGEALLLLPTPPQYLI